MFNVLMVFTVTALCCHVLANPNVNIITWFSFNNSETVKAVTLAFCNIQ